MKRNIARTSLAIVSAAVFLLGIVPMAQATEHRDCSNATLQGSFGYTATGTLLPAAAPPLSIRPRVVESRASVCQEPRP